MNRKDFQRLAMLRLREAEALIKSRHFSGAYYLSGYVVECALKACIAKLTRRHEFPDKKTVESSYTHDFEKLVRVAGLDSELQQERTTKPLFDKAWSLLDFWSEQSRYERKTRSETEELFQAIADKNHGVFQWLSRYW